MSRTQERAGRKSSRRAARTLARARRRESQHRWWTSGDRMFSPEFLAEHPAKVPENLRRRWARRGLLGGGV